MQHHISDKNVLEEEKLTFGGQIEKLVDFMRLQFDLWDDALLLHLQTHDQDGLEQIRRG